LFISDNGKSFTVLTKLLRGTVKWQLLTPAAPWTGGFYERLVGTIKRSCKKTLGNTSLTVSELLTVLVELEDRINRRPLIVLDDYSITPSHFILGGPPPPLECHSFSPSTIPDSSPEILSKILRHRQITSSHLFARWKNEYLLTLRNWRRGSKTVKPCILKVDDVVIVSPPDGIKIPRNYWPLGRVAALHEGPDGLIRNVTLQVKNGFIQRPLSRLYPLECQGMDLPEVTQEKSPSSSLMPEYPSQSIPSVIPSVVPSVVPSSDDGMRKKTRSGRRY
jgi:hypothetical protein